MAVRAAPTDPLSPDAEQILAAMESARARTLVLVAPLSDAQLEHVHSPIMSPLVWDLAHIAAYEDLWIGHRLGGRALLRPDLAALYDAFETPRAVRGEVELLDAGAAREYLAAVRAQASDAIAGTGAGDGVIAEMVLRHELQHTETMRQTMAIAGLLADDDRAAALPDAPGWLSIAAGRALIGATEGGFAYDNERCRHEVELDRFQIARLPVSNASWMHFSEGGGYERREWWSAEGWAWKEEYDITRPGGWTADHRGERRLGSLEPLHPHRPVVHVSWFEADAFARSRGARLPTESEWEKAATWDQEEGEARPYPWGDEPPAPGVHANVDQLVPGPAPAGAYPAGASPYGCLGMIGDVWEWTASEFSGYPGFRPHPYKEYSEPFFEAGYRVLRGGSWATRSRVVTPTFRNWDHPQRRQIFSGFRVAE
jgi:iron(II)-dependent oxidoreductase